MHSSGGVAPSSNTQSDGLDHLMRDPCNLLNKKKCDYSLFKKRKAKFLKSHEIYSNIWDLGTKWNFIWFFCTCIWRCMSIMWIILDLFNFFLLAKKILLIFHNFLDRYLIPGSQTLKQQIKPEINNSKSFHLDQPSIKYQRR